MYITCVTDADLSEEEIIDTLTLLSWYIHRFLEKSGETHLSLYATNSTKYPQIKTKLPETLQYI